MFGPKEQYLFDCSGFLRLPLSCTADVLAAARAELQQGGGSAQSGAVGSVVGELAVAEALRAVCGADYVLDRPPSLADGSSHAQLRSHGHGYADGNGAYPPTALSASLFVAVEPSSLVLVPASHKSSVPAPRRLFRGPAGSDDPFGACEALEVQAGHAVLLCSSLLHAVR